MTIYASSACAVGAIAATVPTHGLPMITHCNPVCNGCGNWLNDMQAEGFQHNDRVTEAMDADLGIPKPLSSCHTTIVAGYLLAPFL